MTVDLGLRTLTLAALRAGLGAVAVYAQSPDRQSPRSRTPSGQRLAQRHCGGCHAVTGSTSPLADAPPFAKLFLRYRPGRLDAVLAEGMLAPRQRPEEGSPSGHPRMPMAQLDDDEVADLKAYLRSLDPRRSSANHCRRATGCPRQD